MTLRMSILHCAETVKGGIATYLSGLLPYQREYFGPHQIRVLVPESQVSDIVCPSEVELVPYSDGGGRVANSVSLARAAYRSMRDFRPDIVHVHSTFAGVAVRPLAALFCRNALLVYCAHGWAWDRPMGRMTRRFTQWVEWSLSLLSDSVVCISDHELQAALASGLSRKRLCLVLNGVETLAPAGRGDSFPADATKLRLLFVGRFDRQKGVDVFSAVLERLGDSAVGIAAGAPVLGDEGDIDLPSNIVRLGWVSAEHVQCLFESADALVVPSRWEGFGLVAVEAMRAGVAVVASRVGGLQEIVDHGVTGFLVESEDIQGITDFFRNADRASLKRMGDAGHQRFLERYTMDRVHKELLDVYHGRKCESDLKV